MYGMLTESDMKVIILNYAGNYVEVSDVPTDIAKMVEADDMFEMDAIVQMGYSPEDIHWMFAGDEIPVFWKNEVAPYTSL